MNKFNKRLLSKFILVIISTVLLVPQKGVIVKAIEKEDSIQQILLSSNLQTETYYRVIVESFKNRENAEKLVAKFKVMGKDAFISQEVINGETYNRVILGSFKNRENAENMVNNLSKAGYDSFIDIFNKEEVEDGSNSQGKERYYMVIVGSFTNKKNAEIRVRELKNDGIDCYISRKDINGKIYNRIIIGSFKSKVNADKMVEALAEYGYEAFVDSYYK